VISCEEPQGDKRKSWPPKRHSVCHFMTMVSYVGVELAGENLSKFILIPLINIQQLIFHVFPTHVFDVQSHCQVIDDLAIEHMKTEILQNYVKLPEAIPSIPQ
jgi:hypothetical protein